MIEIKVYKPIDKEDILWSYFMNEESPFSFSADNIHRIFEEHPEEKEFKFNINCDGGSVSEGLRIYDVLRTQEGKIYHCNIEGGCHSMAIVLLLAAPKENRTANPNARALIHEVRGANWDSLTAQQLRDFANEIEIEQDAILDIYTERTGYDRAELEILMKEEKVRTTQELIKYGFISKINTYSTNQKQTKTMAKNQKDEVLNEATSFLSKLTNLLKKTNEAEIVNFDFMDADGNVLFSTEQADDTLEVGMVASPDGTFTIEDGRTIVIAGGVITEIQDAMTNDAEVEELQNRILELENALNESQTVITNLKNQVTSNYNAKGRQTQTQKGVQNGAKTIAELKNEALEKRQQLKGGK